MMTGLESTIGVAELPSVSFRNRPVLVVENFWSAEERRFFREGMNKATWKQLSDLENVQQDFPDSGNWAKAEIGSAEGRALSLAATASMHSRTC